MSTAGRLWRGAFGLTALLVLLGTGACREAQTPAPASAGMRSALVFERTGGIAGMADRLEVSPEGRMIYHCADAAGGGQGKARTVEEVMPQATLGKLSAQLGQFDTAPGVASDEGPGADRMYYRITYAGRQVETRDGEVPKTLQPLLTTLGNLVNRLRQKC